MGYARVPVKVKAKKEENKEPKETARSGKNEANAVSDDNLSSELREPRWSVVTFESCAASNLTYEKAAEKLEELRAKKVSGLCVVSDEAAKRIIKEK